MNLLVRCACFAILCGAAGAQDILDGVVVPTTPGAEFPEPVAPAPTPAPAAKPAPVAKPASAAKPAPIAAGAPPGVSYWGVYRKHHGERPLAVIEVEGLPQSWMGSPGEAIEGTGFRLISIALDGQSAVIQDVRHGGKLHRLTPRQHDSPMPEPHFTDRPAQDEPAAPPVAAAAEPAVTVPRDVPPARAATSRDEADIRREIEPHAMQHFPVVSGTAHSVPFERPTQAVIFFASGGGEVHVGGVRYPQAGPVRYVGVGSGDACCGDHPKIGSHDGTCFHAPAGSIDVVILDPSKAGSAQPGNAQPARDR
jgi:hypothetical protein